MSLINREDALAQLATLCPDQFSGIPGRIIKNAPAIEAEPIKRGNLKGEKMELIDKRVLHNTLLFMENMENLSYGKKIYNKVIQQVVNMPTIEAEPKHGHWLDREPAPFDQVYETCSECGVRQTLDKGKDNFCGVCGADMRERREDGKNR